MRKKKATRKMTAFLLAAVMCVSLCTGFTADAQEVSVFCMVWCEKGENEKIKP